jgi:hypothetical protein
VQTFGELLNNRSAPGLNRVLKKVRKVPPFLLVRIGGRDLSE